MISRCRILLSVLPNGRGWITDVGMKDLSIPLAFTKVTRPRILDFSRQPKTMTKGDIVSGSPLQTSPLLPVPEPREPITNVELFLHAIGRDMRQFAGLFNSWEHLFTCDFANLLGLGFNQRQAKYILFSCAQYRLGNELLVYTCKQRR